MSSVGTPGESGRCRAEPELTMRCINCSYPLRGIPEPRCPECGTPFDPDDPKSWAPENPPPRRALALGGSFSGAFAAWLLVAGAWALIEECHPNSPFTPPVQKIIDIPSPDRMAALIGILWVLVLLPAHCSQSINGISRGLRGAVALGIAFGTAGALLQLAVGAKPPFDLVAVGILCGLVSELTIWLVLKPRWTLTPVPTPRRYFAALWGAPFALVIAWLFGVWPLICEVAPRMAYRLGGHATREVIVLRLLRDIRPGDPVSKLADRLPELIAPGSTSGSASSAFGSHLVYQITYDGGRFTSVKIGGPVRWSSLRPVPSPVTPAYPPEATRAP